MAAAGDQLWQRLGADLAGWIFTTLPFGVIVYLCVAGMAHAIRYFVEAGDREVQLARLSEQLAGARFSALQAQVNPHFLFNALNTIASLVHENPDAAERVVVRLSALMRKSVDATGELVPLREELDLLATYLDIEQARFEDRLHVEWSIDAGIGEALVPHLILQPIVENSIVHGFRPVAGPVTIDIRIARENGNLEVVVADSGAGYDASHAREGVGLGN
jgi:LytS/YehU family sensor histidine kinase